LTFARLSQIGILLSNTTYFDEMLQLEHQYTPQISPTGVSVFINELLKNGIALLLVPGSTIQTDNLSSLEDDFQSSARPDQHSTDGRRVVVRTFALPAYSYPSRISWRRRQACLASTPRGGLV
jgi:hypothetical protein